MNPIKLVILAILLFLISFTALAVYSGVHKDRDTLVTSVVLSFLITVFFIIYNL